MRQIVIVGVLAMACVAPGAVGAWEGDLIFAANTRYNESLEAVTGSAGKGSEIALSRVDLNQTDPFVGGDAALDGGNYIGMGLSELLGDCDGQWATMNVTAMSRAIVEYDADTFIELAAGKWGSHDYVWLTQVEYVATAPIENAQVAEDAGFGTWIDLEGTSGANSGGQQSGRIQLATDGAGYNAGGADPRLMLGVAPFGMAGSEDVWDMVVDASGNLYICGRNQSDGGQVIKLAKLNATRQLANVAGQRVGDAGVFAAPELLILKGCPDVSPQTHIVNVGPGNIFDPNAITVAVDDTVRWVWMGGVHNVESGVDGVHDGNFRSGDPTDVVGTTFEVTFSQAFLDAHPMAGDQYPYYCALHEEGFDQVGVVNVVEPPVCDLGFGWFTSVDIDAAGNLYLVDRAMQTLDVYAADGSPVMSIPFGAALSMAPEAARLDPSFAGPGVRLIVEVLDTLYVGRLFVLDVDVTTQTWSVVNQLQNGSLPENGAGASLDRVDNLYVSPAGDVITQDSRGSGDDRWNVITAESLSAAIDGTGNLVTVNVDVQSVWGYTGFYYGRGLAFAQMSLPYPPQLVESDPPMNGTLCKAANNIIRLTFDKAIEIPATGGHVTMLSIIPIGTTNDYGVDFAYVVEPDGVTLKATESEGVLTDQTWYRITPYANNFPAVQFELDVCTLIGDANYDGTVLASDLGQIWSHNGEVTDGRWDIDGNGQVLAADLGLAWSNNANTIPPKP